MILVSITVSTRTRARLWQSMGRTKSALSPQSKGVGRGCLIFVARMRQTMGLFVLRVWNLC
jgi:hypothetical protein